MSNVTRIGDHPKGRGKCDICGRPDHGTLQLVKDQDDQFIVSRVRCINCINEWGEHDIEVDGHIMGRCEPEIDMDTRWQLLALLSDMVEHRDRCGDLAVSKLVDQLGAIIERHEPSSGGDREP